MGSGHGHAKAPAPGWQEFSEGTGRTRPGGGGLALPEQPQLQAEQGGWEPGAESRWGDRCVHVALGGHGLPPAPKPGLIKHFVRGHGAGHIQLG